jgi:hypothetical protein
MGKVVFGAVARQTEVVFMIIPFSIQNIIKTFPATTDSSA